MAEMQPTLNIDHSLNDDDCDIQVEYGSVLDGAFDMRRKLASVSRQAPQLERKLLAKQAEQVRYIARQSSSNCPKSSTFRSAEVLIEITIGYKVDVRNEMPIACVVDALQKPEEEPVLEEVSKSFG
jgi:hypothetical protein